MSRNPKVVSFERSAAYVHYRAMKNRRDNHPVDALELMRQAVAQSPENSEYKLDLAEMYCEMGCHEQSNRILLDMLVAPDAPDECYYGLALNQLGRNELSSAKRALNIYLSKADDGFAEEANILAAEMAFFDEMSRPVDRKRGRAAKIAGRACELLKAGEYEKAEHLFVRALEFNEKQGDMRALYALTLKQLGRDDEALLQAKKCVEEDDAGVRGVCLCAQLYWMCGEKAHAERLMKRCAEEHPTGVELRLMIFAYGEMEMHEAASEALRLALRETPHDKALLHMRAVALKKCGSADETLAAFWRRILRIDPDDTVASYYLNATRNHLLDECGVEYYYQVPQREYRRRLIQIADQLSGDMEAVKQKCAEDREFRNLLEWAVATGEENCGKAAMMALASVPSSECESIVRELLYRGDVAMTVKLHGMLFLRLRGADVAKLLPPDMNLSDGLLPEAEQVLAQMPVCERQLVRFADEILEREYGVQAASALALMWRGYREMRKPLKDALVCTQEAAAALAWNYLLQHGKTASVPKLARQFGCNQRRMVFYARRMAATLDKIRRNGTDEDH